MTTQKILLICLSLVGVYLYYAAKLKQNYLQISGILPSEVDIWDLINSTKYKNYLSLYHSSHFQKLYQNCNFSEKAKILKHMFHYSWNYPNSAHTATQKIKRFPDVIGIGCKKCSTSAVDFYLSLHPNFHSNVKEKHFFDNNFDRGIEFYLKSFEGLTRSESLNSKNSIVFEKTPKYLTGEKIINRMQASLPNFDQIDFILSLCDPVKRFFSDYIHVHSSGEFGGIIRQKYGKSGMFRYFDEMSGFLEKYQQNHTEMEFYNLVRNVYSRNSRTQTPGEPGLELSILTNGLYIIHLNDWLNHIETNKLFILNGDKMVTNLPTLIKNLETQLDLPKFFKTENFIRDKHGFYCYETNSNYLLAMLDASTRNLTEIEKSSFTLPNEYFRREGVKCLSKIFKSKNNTRQKQNSNVTETVEILDLKRKLYKFYKPFNTRLFKLLGQEFDFNSEYEHLFNNQL